MPAFDYLTVFHDRHRHLVDLLALARQQPALVAADDYAGLLTILGAKQRLLGRLEENGRGEQALWQRWREDREALPPGVRHRCEQTLESCEIVLAELLEHERVSTTQLEQRRHATRRELHEVTAGVHVNEAYRDSLAPATHRHLDVGDEP